jgi:AcrR family transcriptional regulator
MADKSLLKKEEFRREILVAARELFSCDGYGNFSMRKLARRIGYSPTTIYLYFKDKDEILFCLCEELYAELYQTILEIENENNDLLTTLRSVLLAYVSFGLANPDHYRVAFFTNPSVYGSPSEFFDNDTMSRRAYLHYRELVAACSAAGVLKSMDVDVLAQVLWSGVHGLVSAALHTRDFPLVDPNVLAECMVTGLLDGLKGSQCR